MQAIMTIALIAFDASGYYRNRINVLNNEMFSENENSCTCDIPGSSFGYADRVQVVSKKRGDGVQVSGDIWEENNKANLD